MSGRVTRPQAEALLRAFGVVMRRKQALSLLRERIAPIDDAWASEIEDGSAERIVELCGDAEQPPKDFTTGFTHFNDF